MITVVDDGQVKGTIWRRLGASVWQARREGDSRTVTKTTADAAIRYVKGEV